MLKQNSTHTPLIFLRQYLSHLFPTFWKHLYWWLFVFGNFNNILISFRTYIFHWSLFLGKEAIRHWNLDNNKTLFYLYTCILTAANGAITSKVGSQNVELSRKRIMVNLPTFAIGHILIWTHTDRRLILIFSFPIRSM